MDVDDGWTKPFKKGRKTAEEALVLDKIPEQIIRYCDKTVKTQES